MRPPAHWQLGRRRRSRTWPAFAGAATVIAVLAVLLWFGQSGGEEQSEVLSSECATIDCVPQGGSEPTPLGQAPPQISGTAAAIVEGGCGALIYGQRAHAELPPASLTKIVTALVAVERMDPVTMVDVRVNSSLLAASTASTVMGLEPGLRLSLRDLLHGLILPSGNDAAIAIAEGVASSEPEFVALMNEYVAELRLRNTHFSNSHGLDQVGLYSSAFDMAMLGRALLADPELSAIVRTERYQPAWDGPVLLNSNLLLTRYPAAIGVKIGFTDDAGQTIVGAARRGGRLLIVSVFGSSDRYLDAIALFEWAFAETEQEC